MSQLPAIEVASTDASPDADASSDASSQASPERAPQAPDQVVAGPEGTASAPDAGEPLQSADGGGDEPSRPAVPPAGADGERSKYCPLAALS